jgi:PAS domain S-box-containing protein
MSFTIRRLVLSYGIAAGGVVLAGLSHWWLAPVLGDTPTVGLLLIVVVMASGWMGGLGPGLFATLLGLLAIVAANDAPGDIPSLVSRLIRFGSLGLLITVLYTGLHAYRHRAEFKDTQLRQAELSLREKESVLSSFYESSALAMGVIEQTETDTRFVSANALTEKFFGLDPGELAGKTAVEVGASPEMMATWIERFRECRLTGQPIRFEYRADCASSPEWVAATLSPMGAHGSAPALCSFIVEDITDRKRTERDLRDAKELAEAACQAKDRFLAVLSHELRTPLTPALIGVSAILDSKPGPSILPTLEMIHRNIELEARLIDDLLDLSRLGRGKLRLDLETVDIHEAIRRAIEICRDETLVAGLNVLTSLDAAQHHVTADHARVMQIVWNLIHNAAKFTPPGGSLTIRTKNETTHPTSSHAPECARIVVEFEDTGVGIDPAVLPRIFESFEQGPDKPRGKSRGLGLGLAISRALAEALGGRLTASSRGRGLGSSFRIELETVPTPALPAARSHPALLTDESIGGPGRPGLRILVVEDNRDTLRFLASSLRQRGHDVVAADRIATARAAVEAARYPFDLLLSDIELPDGDGLCLMRELSASTEWLGIALSGFGSEDDLRQSREAGFLDHLTKPIDLHRLESAIGRAAALIADRAREPERTTDPICTQEQAAGSGR